MLARRFFDVLLSEKQLNIINEDIGKAAKKFKGCLQ